MKQFFSAGLVLAALYSAPAVAQPTAFPAGGNTSITAVVNGQVITTQDIAGRASLLAITLNLPSTPQTLARLEPQVRTQLIDQTLKLQEIDRRKIVVSQADIISSISHIEQSNNLPPGGLRQKLEAAGVPFNTLVSQIRTELGWQSVLHQVLGPGLQPTPGDMRAEKSALTAELGSTQYHVAEIFVAVSDPASDQTARDYANTVIAQLRAGAPFPIVAAQFSQGQTALQGGDLGFVEPSQLDPAVAKVVEAMPTGAISDPIRVPGGYDIVQLQGVHNVGNSMQTILSLRQAFAPYATITTNTVGAAQAAVITKLVHDAAAAHSCDDITALNATLGNVRQADPGPVNLATVTPPAFQNVLTNLPLNQVSRPLIAQDGVSVVMVCSRTQQAQSLPSDDEIENIIINRRVDLESQQMMDQLHHRSIITMN